MQLTSLLDFAHIEKNTFWTLCFAYTNSPLFIYWRKFNVDLLNSLPIEISVQGILKALAYHSHVAFVDPVSNTVACHLLTHSNKVIYSVTTHDQIIGVPHPCLFINSIDYNGQENSQYISTIPYFFAYNDYLLLLKYFYIFTNQPDWYQYLLDPRPQNNWQQVLHVLPKTKCKFTPSIFINKLFITDLGRKVLFDVQLSNWTQNNFIEANQQLLNASRYYSCLIQPPKKISSCLVENVNTVLKSRGV